MSEYQYYEFLALDGPISDEGLHYARGCSSRATVSRFRWQNVYHFGDFHGSAEKLLTYYDAHLYTANWGTVRLGLSFPEGCLPPEAVQPYLRGGERYEDTLTVKEVGNRCIFWWELNEEGGWGHTEGEGLLDELVGLREELMGGDYRALFLGWLAGFDADEWRDSKDRTVVLPPVPAGLNRLSPALVALVQHFQVDRDALAVAAELTADRPPTSTSIAAALEGLPVPQMQSLLKRVAEGDGAMVMSELKRLTKQAPTTPVGPDMSCTDFAARIVDARQARRIQEAEATAAKTKKEAETRRQRLATVMERADSIWAGLDHLMDLKIASAYEQATAQLQELRDAHQDAGEHSKFQRRLTIFREQYARRPAMLRRIEKL
ncbi:MAG: hypothetical protein HY299_05825 [Verrucomicrobia bacterium]|nr:hypothetical protein [Verrucomicrobiota bacterium]